MVEVSRFFDTFLYSEADQAEVQKRFRPNGVLPEVDGKLEVGAPGGMFVSIAPGEAMVEGFWYKNTASFNLAIASNSSGSQRYDSVVAQLSRTTNEIRTVVIQGTPGAGIPAWPQIVGGTWAEPLAIITIPSGTSAINLGMISSAKAFSYSTRTGANILHNASFRVNQRSTVNTYVNGEHLVDRWICAMPTGSIFGDAHVAVAPPNMGLIPGAFGTSRALVSSRILTGAIGAGEIDGVEQHLDGPQALPIAGQDICVSWRSYSAKRGIYGFNLESISGWRYIASWAHGIENGWQDNYIVIPWNDVASWDFQGNALALVARWVYVAGSNTVHTGTNQWTNVAGKYAPVDITNNLPGLSDQMWISHPKIEVGNYPTRWQMPSLGQEQAECYRYLWVDQPDSLLEARMATTQQYVVIQHVFPTQMRAVPAFSYGGATLASAVLPADNRVSVIYGLGPVTSGPGITTWTHWIGSTTQRHTLLLPAVVFGSGAAYDTANLYVGTGARLVHSAEV